MITIIDYGMGNLGSIKNMLKKVGEPAVISGNLKEILQAEKLILPGVGAFDTAMQNLHDLGMVPVLAQKVLVQKTPILGICLGMQLMTCSSEEGKKLGLGWINGVTIRFNFTPGNYTLKVPHMGWNSVVAAKESALLKDLNDEARFYFVHSYYVACHHSDDVLLYTIYGFQFASAFQSGNITGVQFHPEKSHKFGMKLLKNFAEAF